MASRAPQPETRYRILQAAEEHFRRYGYAKTTMADIAEACGMSPANVYRFFDSKAALIEAIAGLWFAKQQGDMTRIARRNAPAADRLRAFLIEHHDYVRTQHTSEGRVHDMCAMVIDKRWPIVQAHIQRMRRILAEILESGLATGEFEIESDIETTAVALHNAMIKFHHPMVVAQFDDQALTAEAHAMADLLIRSLRPGVAPDENRQSSLVMGREAPTSV